MKRQTFLPCVDKYPEVGFWMKFYERWQQHSGELRVVFGMQHGEALTKMVKESDADVVLFMEMDGIIFNPGIVDQCFSLIEGGLFDIVASERMSCSPEVARIAKDRFNLSYEGTGDHGPAFWPNFFFIKRDILLKTDLDFMPKRWNKGDSLLGYDVLEEAAGDTMVWMSLQLRGLVPPNKIKLVNQYHSHPDDLIHYHNRTEIFDGNSSWIHIGSISGDPFIPKTEMERKELTKRLVWQELSGKTVDKSMVDENEFNEWKKAYKELLYI